MKSVKDIENAIREKSAEMQAAVVELTKENEKAAKEMGKGIEELQKGIEDKEKEMKGKVEKIQECQEEFTKAFYG